MATQNPAQTFLIEADELLGQIEEVALDITPQSAEADAVNRLFRAFHTIKGSGAMFGFDAVASFTHHVETALDKVREGSLALTQELLTLILSAKDQIKALLEAATTGAPIVPGSSEKLIAAFQALGGNTPPAASASAPVSATACPAALAGKQTYAISFRPAPSTMVSGTNPATLLNELRALGECSVRAQTGAIPSLQELKADQCYISWEIGLTTDKGLNAIKDVFVFVEDGSALSITPAATASPPAQATAAKAPGFPKPSPSPDAGTANAPARASSTRKTASKDSLVRVPSDKLDTLVNLVGELVMNQSRLTQVASRIDAPELAAPVEEIERLISELRDNVLGIRMMPIGSTFSRFKRLVHDLSHELGKEIDLVAEGAETELDKTVIDRLGDPLVHLIRNSIDHGIEPVATREQKGKPRRGTIRLIAAHVGSYVSVTIQDDGKGLDAAAIQAKAVEKKLIAPDAVLSEKEAFNLIFLPGLSTAKQITSVSGRGVGMDVVKRQIDALRGSVSIQSAVGIGTTISLTLPLTLAIIDGLLVNIGASQYIIPMSAVTENIELPRTERSRNNGRNVVAIRGELVPYVRLRDLFASTEAELNVERIVIVRHEDQRVGLVVDHVLGSHQTVIQSLGRFYRDIKVVSGATIMGDGRVALILDVAGLVRFANQRAASTSQDESLHDRMPPATSTTATPVTPLL